MVNTAIKPFKLLFTDKSIPLDITFFSLLIICIPITLITGPALPDIFLSITALYFLIKSILNKLWNYYKKPLVIFFLFFCAYSITRSLFSDMPFQSLTTEGSVFYFRYIFFAMAIWYLLDKNPYLAKCLFIISISCLVLVSFDGLYQYLKGIDFFGNPKHSHYRLTGLFGNEPILGRYISYLCLFTFSLMYQNYKNTKKKIILSVTMLVMCEVIVFLSGERVPLFYLIFFTLAVLVYAPHYRMYRILGVFVSCVIIIGILEVNPNAKARMIDHTIDQIKETKLPFLPYSKSYENHYLSALRVFSDNPIFGSGPNTYRYQCNNPKYVDLLSKCNTHPHNFYFQVLAELGIIGFLFLSIFYLYLSYIAIKQLILKFFYPQKKQIPFEVFLYLLILVIYWWPLIPHMSFYNNWNNVIMMLSLGFFMKYFYSNYDGNSDEF